MVRLRQAERLSATGQLAAPLAYEIRTPLASIEGAAEMINGDIAPALRSEMTGILRKESSRLSRLLANLLNYAKPRPTEFTEADLRDVVLAVVNLVSPSARHQEVKLHFAPPNNPVPLYRDGQQWQQLLLDLTLNPVQSIPKGATSNSRWSAVPGSSSCASPTPAPEFRSTSATGSSTRSTPQNPTAPNSSSNSPSFRKPAHDSYDSAVRRRHLAVADYATAARGRRPLERQPFQGVVSDLLIPGQSGLHLLRSVKADYPEPPEILLTAYGSVESAVEAMKCGALDYLTKPADQTGGADRPADDRRASAGDATTAGRGEEAAVECEREIRV